MEAKRASHRGDASLGGGGRFASSYGAHADEKNG